MALAATLTTWGVTALGAATVIFFRAPREAVMRVLVGFAAGVMIAASFWSLLRPAVDMAETLGQPPWFVATGGFLCGAVFLWGTDRAVSWARGETASTPRRRGMLLLTAITLHNIPEGLAVGVAFGALAEGASPGELSRAVLLALGVALQNFPEGAAASLPLRQEGLSRGRSFLLGQASGMVEPIAGVLGAMVARQARPLLPAALAFAAGAMVLVTVHELIPECQQGRDGKPYQATLGIMGGFALMMLLDVLLG
jgi:ZIP family zinc transporter